MEIKPDLFITFAKIGAFTFGGGYAMISLLENECVARKKWLTHEEFMDMTVIAETTPGPVAINAATYIGHKMAGVSGAALATMGVVLPSFVILFFISSFFENFLQYEIVDKAFHGIRAAVALLIIRAGLRMVRELLKSEKERRVNLVFMSVFFAIVFIMNFVNYKISTIYLIFVAGLLGFFVFRQKENEK